MKSPFPLCWPDGFKRTPAKERTTSKFGYKNSGQVPFAHAYTFLVAEIGRLGALNSVITSDLPTRQDGIPYSSSRATDPGVAVWLVVIDDTTGRPIERTFACDRWLSHAENMYAIAKSIEAMRGLERWGMSDVAQRTFAGFNALPPGAGSANAPPKKPWREVLGETFAPWPEIDRDELLVLAKGRYRKLIAIAHPDRGGDVDRAATLNVALSEAERELGAPQ